MDNIYSTKLFNLYRIGIIILLFPLMSVFCFWGNIGKVFFATVLSAGMLLLCKYLLYKNTISKRGFYIGIWCFTLLVRIVTCIIVNPNLVQISDFFTTLKHAKSGYFYDDVEYYRFFLHKMLYPYILNRLSLNTQLKIIMFQCFCTSFIPLILYKIGQLIERESVGAISAILYSCWPGQIIYTAIVTEEHIASLITVLMVYFVLSICKKYVDKESDRNVFIHALLVGVLFALSSFFKDWALVVFVALVIVSILFFFNKRFEDRWKYLGVICVIIFTRIAFQGIITTFLENTLGEKANNNIIVHQMYESLNPNSNGGYNPEIVERYFSIAREYNYNFEDINRVALSELLEEIKSNSSKMPVLLVRKGRNAYEDDEQLFSLVFEQGNINESPYVYKIFMYFGTIYYIMLIFGILCSSLLNKQNIYLMFINICMIGGLFVSFLVESQSRYKYSIEPIWTILVAFSLINISEKIMRVKNKIEIIG